MVNSQEYINIQLGIQR